MKKVALILIVMISAVFADSCNTVLISGRKQVNLVPESTMLDMSLTNYNDFLKSNKVSNNSSEVQLVQQTGKRIASAVEEYLRNHGMKDEISNYKWEFNLVVNDSPNAWCMPGGKVVVYTGILPYTKNQEGLAVVMGHEIAHAVAHHGNERMSQQLLVQLGGMALSTAIEKKPEETKQIFMTAYGAGASLGVLLPYSRAQETEADHLGLIFMAMAGFDPHGAIDFWKRMEQSGGQQPPEFLSTHPSHQTRIQNLEKFMSEAMKYYTK